MPPSDPDALNGLAKLADGRLGTEGPLKISYPPAGTELEMLTLKVSCQLTLTSRKLRTVS